MYCTKTFNISDTILEYIYSIYILSIPLGIIGKNFCFEIILDNTNNTNYLT